MSGFDDVNYYFRRAARVMDLSAHVEKMLAPRTERGDNINAELQRHMREAYATLAHLARERRVSFRTAAFIIAIGRVGRATVLRGV